MKLPSLTKIIATISDLRCDIDFLRKLHHAGMSAVRINTAHQNFEGSEKIIQNLRQVSDSIPVIIDTKGPELRTTSLSKPLELRQGDHLYLGGSTNNESSPNCVFVNYEHFVQALAPGNRILVDDGELELLVIEKNKDNLLCRAINAGKLAGHKGVNVPGVHIPLPSLSNRDRDYIDFAIQQEVDFIAHSFVRNVEDVACISDILEAKNSNCKIIAKIENQEGVDNIDSIISNVYGVMVARGDLGIEIAAEQIPNLQKMIIRKCRENCRTVITATQMLHSMIEKPRPTRAEVSDVANAVYDGTDCLMLSGETAQGKYPIEAVETMVRIARMAEKSTKAMVNIDIDLSESKIPTFLAKTAVSAENILPISAIVIDTATGRTARYLSAFRGNVAIYVQSYTECVSRQLGIVYGVRARYNKVRHTSVDFFIRQSLNILLEGEDIGFDDTVLVLAGHFGPSTGASFLEISTVRNMLTEFKEIDSGNL